MKNFKLILILVAALGMSVVSCSKDDDPAVDLTPSIDFKGGSDYISADATVIAGEEFKIGITASSNTSSGKNLTSVKYTITSNDQIVLEEDSVFNENAYNVDYFFRMDNEGMATFKFDVTDKDGQMSSKSLTITAEPGTTPLEDPEVTYFERVGGADATGLDMFGLKWENNLKVVSAVIEKDVATKLVMLDATAWTTLATMEDLVAAVDAAEDMDDYRGVSVEADGTYDDVLGVINGDVYYMIHITSAEVTVDQLTGTTVKINGESKK